MYDLAHFLAPFRGPWEYTQQGVHGRHPYLHMLGWTPCSCAHMLVLVHMIKVLWALSCFLRVGICNVGILPSSMCTSPVQVWNFTAAPRYISSQFICDRIFVQILARTRTRSDVYIPQVVILSMCKPIYHWNQWSSLAITCQLGKFKQNPCLRQISSHFAVIAWTSPAEI